MQLQTILKYFISLIWLINGLFCKIINLVPRHEMIVTRILGESHARVITLLIGFAETLMAIWILTGVKKRIGAIFQIATIAAMNLLEFIMAPDLLLWGRFNAVFALLFIGLIYYANMYPVKRPAQLI